MIKISRNAGYAPGNWRGQQNPLTEDEDELIEDFASLVDLLNKN